MEKFMEYLKIFVYIFITAVLFFCFYISFSKISSIILKLDEKLNKETRNYRKFQKNMANFGRDIWNARKKDYEKTDKMPEEEEKEDIPECLSVLGFTRVPEDKGEIQTRYRKLSKIYHPDMGGTQEEFQRIKKAWDTAKKLYNIK